MKDLATPEAAILPESDAVPCEHEPAFDVGMFASQRRGVRAVMRHSPHRNAAPTCPASTRVVRMGIGEDLAGLHSVERPQALGRCYERIEGPRSLEVT
jgi:hypothetical protein